MITQARFTLRPSDQTGKPDIGFIVCFRNNTMLKSQRVYEIVEIMGTLVIRDIGPSVLGVTAKDGILSYPSWAQEFGDVLTHSAGHAVLTVDEMDPEVVRQRLGYAMSLFFEDLQLWYTSQQLRVCVAVTEFFNQLQTL